MTTPTSPIQAERDAIAREYAHAPQAQQALLALLSAQTPPAGEEAPPPMPPDLLDRLRGRYGVTPQEQTHEVVLTSATQGVPVRPGFLDRLREWFTLPAMQWGGLATACVAIVMGVLFLRPAPVQQENTGTAPDQWRGGPAPVAQSGPLYVWLGGASHAARAAVADKVPDLMDVASAEEARQLSLTNPQAPLYTLDPATATVTLQIHGEVLETRPVRPGTAPEALSGGLLDALRKAQRTQAP